MRDVARRIGRRWFFVVAVYFVLYSLLGYALDFPLAFYAGYVRQHAFGRLQDENLGNPRPGLLFVLWRGSHPSLGERIDFANRYRPWDEGRPLRYRSLFKGD